MLTIKLTYQIHEMHVYFVRKKEQNENKENRTRFL